MTELSYSIVENWPDTLIAQLSDFTQRRLAGGGWAGRWHADIDAFRWKVADQGRGPAIGALATAGDEIVGSTVVTFRPGSLEGRPITIAELGDLSVDEALRGMGIFRKLVSIALDATERRGADIVFCAPNEASLQALIKTGRFVPGLGARTWLMPLRPFELLSRRLSAARLLRAADAPVGALLSMPLAVSGDRRAVSATTIGEAGDILDALARPNTPHTVFGAGQLAGRIAAHPLADSYGAYRKGGDGAIIYRRCAFHDSPAWLIGAVRARDPGTWNTLMARAVADARLEGAAIIAFWSPSGPAQTRRMIARGFIPTQKKSIVFATRPLSAQLSEPPSSLDISMLDSDKI